MKKVVITQMSDWNDCEQCGGGSEDGGVVTIDGVEVFSHIPHAGCYGNNDVSVEQLLIKALEALGVEVEIKYEDVSDYEDYYGYEGDGE